MALIKNIKIRSLPVEVMAQLPMMVRIHIEYLENVAASLLVRVEALEKQISKDSTNSHKPPSSDGPRKGDRTKSERGVSGRRPGGQGGHSGNTLRKSLTPDFRVRHGVSACGKCHADLSKRRPDFIEERQVIDLPPQKFVTTAHEVESKICPCCREKTKASFPGLLGQESGSVIYGERIRALSVYLTQGQLIPYERTQEVLEDFFEHRISVGTLANWSAKASRGLIVTENGIKELLTKSLGAVHFDETGVQALKKNHWIHSASNDRLTYFKFHEKRGKEALRAIDILPRFKGVAIHDRWRSYFEYIDCRHGICGAHLIRDLRYVAEEEEECWAERLRKVFIQMNDAVKRAKKSGQWFLSSHHLRKWKKKYDELLHEGFQFHKNLELLPDTGKRGRKKQREGKNLLDALQEHKKWILLFLHDFNVPFTNNQAERDIRMTKVKMKISGCFRSKAGAEDFCRIRGYLSTAKKQGWSLLDALASVFAGSPLQPTT